MHFPTDRTAPTTAFDGRVVNHRLKQKIAQTANASTNRSILHAEGSKPLQQSALLPALCPASLELIHVKAVDLFRQI